MSNTGTVKISMKLDDQGVVRGFRDVSDASKTAGDQGERSFSKMDKAALSFRSTAMMTTSALAKMGIGVTALAAGMAALTHKAMESAVEIERNSQMAGVTTRAYQQLEYAAKQYHVSTDALTDGLKELNLRAEEFAVTGAGPGKEAFTRLGYAQDELNKKLKDTPALLTEIIQRMEGMENASKMRLADEIFGGQGGEQFVAVINGGAKALEDLKQEAEALGVVMDDSMIRKSIDAQKEVGRLKDLVGSQLNIVIAEIADKVSDVAINTADWIVKNKELIDQGMDVVVGTIRDAFDFLTTSIDQTSGAVKTLIEWNDKFTPGFLSWFSDAQIAKGKDLNALINTIGASTDATGKIVQTVSKDFSDVFAAHFKTGAEAVKATLKTVGATATSVATKASADMAAALKAFEDDHARATLSAFDYQVQKLDQQYAYYDTFVKDKNKLDQWYVSEYFELYDTQVEKEVDAQERLLKEQEDARQEALDEQERQQEEAAEAQAALLEEQQEAYDELYEKVYDITRSVIDDWDSMGETLVDSAKEMIKDIAAAFLSKTIVIPVYMYAAESLGLGSYIDGGSGSTDTGSGLSVSGISDISSLYQAVTGGTSSAVGNLLGSGAIGSTGESIFGSLWGTYGGVEAGTGSVASSGIVGTVAEATPAGIISSLAYTTIGDMLGLPQSEYSGITSGLGGAAGYSIGASIGSGFPVIGTIVGALAGGLLGSLFGEDEPTYRLGMVNGNDMSDFTGSNRVAASESGYQYRLVTQDYDVKDVDAFFDFYDQVFEAIDEVTTASINDLLLNAQTGDYGRIAWFDPSGGTTEENLTQMTDDLFKALQKGLVEDIGEGFDAGVFDYDFFESIKSGEEALLDTYLNFRDVVESLGTNEFLEQFTHQVENLGLSAADAYSNIVTIVSTLDSISAGVDTITSVSAITSLNTLTDSWAGLITTLETARVSVDQMSEAESNRAVVLGANITGVTADNLYSTLTSGGDLDSLLDTAITSSGYAEISRIISEKYVEGLNEEIGNVWLESDGDIQAVISAMKSIDTTAAQAEILELQEAFGLIETSVADVVDTITDTEPEEDADAIDEALFAAFEDARDTFIDAFESEIDSITSAWESRRSDLSAKIDDLRDEKSSLESAITEARSDYIDALNAEINVQKDLKSAAEDAVEALESVIESLKDGVYDIQGNTSNAANITKYEYQAALKGAWSGNVDKMAALPDAALAYQESVLSTASSADEYKRISNQISIELNSIRSIAAAQVTKRQREIDGYDKQIGMLESQIEDLGGISDALLSIDDAAKAYHDAQLALDESNIEYRIIHHEELLKEMDKEFSSWKEKANEQLAILQATDEKTLTFGEAANAYYQALVSLGQSNLYHQAEYQDDQLYMLSEIKRVIEEGSSGSIQSFAGGGIATGPSSGYQVTMHGTEAVFQMKNGVVPFQITGAATTGQSSSGDSVINNSMLNAIADMNKNIRKLFSLFEDVTDGILTLKTESAA